MTGKKLNLTYIIGTYPGLTTTFIDREIEALRRCRADIRVLAVRRPKGMLSHAQETLRRNVTYLLPVSWPKFIAGHLRFALLRPRAYFGTLSYLLSRPHPNLTSRWKTGLHFAEGVYAAELLRGSDTDHFHAHFMDRAAVIALVASRLYGIRHSLTAHANDIYVDPVLLPEKIENASFVATCTRFNQNHLSGLVSADQAKKICCIYHGLDIEHYHPGEKTNGARPVLTAVGQLKEKKGFAYLIKACRLLKDLGYEFHCQIVGEGPLRPDLEQLITELTLEDSVQLLGALSHEEVIERYRQSTVFVLPSVLGADGSRDGIPNVILEAMAMELPVVSTQVSAIPEVVEDEINGLLVPQKNEAALARAVARLFENPDLRRDLGRNGRQKVAEAFDVERNAARLMEAFQSL